MARTNVNVWVIHCQHFTLATGGHIDFMLLLKLLQISGSEGCAANDVSFISLFIGI